MGAGEQMWQEVASCRSITRQQYSSHPHGLTGGLVLAHGVMVGISDAVLAGISVC